MATSGGVGLRAPAAKAPAPKAPPPAAGGNGAPHTPAKPQGTAGHWVQSGGKWQLIHAVGPGHWVQGAKPGFNAPAKPKGLSPASNPNNQANWLQPLTPAQVKQQATNTISSTYAPALNDLNQQSSQEQSIMAKQDADNQYYMQWLDAKSSSLNLQQQAVDQSTSALEQSLTGNQQTTMGAQSTDLINAANARAGNVTNNAQSNAFGAELTGNQQAAQQQEGASATTALQGEQTAQAQLGASTTNTVNALNAGATKEEGDFNTTMTKIATAKASDLSKETADVQKEIARLQGVQISVSENNRNYDTAAAKLGVSVANTNSEIQQRAANTKLSQQKTAISQQNANTSAARLSETIAQNAFNDKVKGETLTMDQQKTIESIANTTSEIGLRNAEAAQKKNGALTPTEQNTYYNILDKATGEVNSLLASGLSGNEAYAAVLSGGYYGKGLNSKGQPVAKHITVPRLSNQSLLNAAYNLRQGGPGLNSGDTGYLGRLGLTTVAQRYAGRIVQATTNANHSVPGHTGP